MREVAEQLAFLAISNCVATSHVKSLPAPLFLCHCLFYVKVKKRDKEQTPVLSMNAAPQFKNKMPSY